MPYSRKPDDYNEQLVAITLVDTVGLTAVGITRQRASVNIDLRYHCGALHVIPVRGEQWFVKRTGMSWALDHKVPFNTTDLHTDATPGQVQVGSSGPLHLNGSTVAANAPLRIASYGTDERPTAATAGVGAVVFDTDLGKPIFSDGSSWKDAAGSAV